MSLPALVLCLVVASLYAGLFHAVFARRGSDLPHYWGAAIAGFVFGSLLGLLTPWNWLVMGQVHMLEGTLGCIGALSLVRWLRGAERA